MDKIMQVSTLTLTQAAFDMWNKQTKDLFDEQQRIVGEIASERSNQNANDTRRGALDDLIMRSYELARQIKERATTKIVLVKATDSENVTIGDIVQFTRKRPDGEFDTENPEQVRINEIPSIEVHPRYDKLHNVTTQSPLGEALMRAGTIGGEASFTVGKGRGAETTTVVQITGIEREGKGPLRKTTN